MPLVRTHCGLALALSVLATGCGTDVSSLSVRIEYQADSCGAGPASSAFFEQESTVSVFVINADVDTNPIVAGDCADLPMEPFRALNDLPRVLEDNIALEPIPFDTRVTVQIAVHEPTVECLPYRPGGDGPQEIPKYFGFTEPPVVVTREVEMVSIVMFCPQP